MKAMFATSRDTINNIAFLEDKATHFGCMTITNDAEHVVDYCRALYGNKVRVVYKDTDNEWWEIKWSLELDRGTVVSFERWNGLAWDILKR